MQYGAKPSFDRSFKKLTKSEKIQAEQSINKLYDFFERRQQLPKGLGLKRLGSFYWEIRSGIDIRIIFSIEDNFVTFLFVGNHDQIAKFIRS